MGAGGVTVRAGRASDWMRKRRGFPAGRFFDISIVEVDETGAPMFTRTHHKRQRRRSVRHRISPHDEDKCVKGVVVVFYDRCQAEPIFWSHIRTVNERKKFEQRHRRHLQPPEFRHCGHAFGKITRAWCEGAVRVGFHPNRTACKREGVRANSTVVSEV